MTKRTKDPVKLMKKYLKKNPQIKKSLDLLNITIPEYERAMEALSTKKIEISVTTTS